MKICIIVTHYLPHIGGLELATNHLANELTQLGHEVHIITPQASVATDKAIDTAIVHRFPIPGYPEGNTLLVLLKGFLFFKKAIDCINKIRPDVIQAQNVTNSFPAYLVGKKINCPYIIVMQGDLELMGIFLTPLLKNYWSYLPHLKNAERIIVLNKNTALKAEPLLHKSIIVMANGVDTNVFYPIKKQNIEVETHKIICVSRLDDKKGLEYAIQSMVDILKLYPDATLKIIGDGYYRQTLEQLVRTLNLTNSVHFMGLIPNNEIPNELRASDIFLLPSLHEGFALTLLEAMACGLPIVSTPVGSVPEIMNVWENGIMVPLKDPDQIAKAIITIFNDTALKLKYGERSVNAINESLTWKSIAKKYETLYNSVIT